MVDLMEARVTGEAITPEEIANIQMHMWLDSFAPARGGSPKTSKSIEEIMKETSLNEVIKYRGQLNLSDSIQRKHYENCLVILRRGDLSNALDVSKNRAYREFLGLHKIEQEPDYSHLLHR